MNTAKIAAGLACIVTALLLLPLAWFSFSWGMLWFKFAPVAFIVGLAAVGTVLILKRRSQLSKLAKTLITVFLSVFIVNAVMLDSWIRIERHALQIRAREFLSKPVPEMFKTDAVDFYQARPGETVLAVSRRLIERYANKGRMRWTAAISGEFAVQPFETDACATAAETNEEARLYVVACKAIIDREWHMGFWQAVEDTLEMRLTIPEFEEEDRIDKFIQRLDGTWTNGSGMMKISPNGAFSAIWSDATKTTILKGAQCFRAEDTVLVVSPDHPDGTEVDGERELRILHLDDHNLIFVLDGQTNRMRR